MGDWASFEVTFKLVDKNDPAAGQTNIWTSSSLEGGQGWRNLGGKATVYPAQNQPIGTQGINVPTVGQQLIDLQRAKDSGAITESEFQAQKAKLLETK